MYYITANTYFIILLFYNICCVYSKINIGIKVASSKGGITVNFGGTDKKIVTDFEINTFNITEANVMKGVSVEFGKKPDDVYFKDPTPYGYLYNKYNWSEVHRVLTVKSVELNEIINENNVLSVHDFVNGASQKIKVPVNLYVNVENTLKSWWSDEGLPHDDIVYKTKVDFDVKQFSFENKWRNDNFKIITLPYGLQKPGFVNINPGKGVAVRLKGKKTLLVFKINYAAYLTGSVIANYEHLLGKYHFWSPSILNIMKAANLNTELITTEMLEVKIYTDPELEVVDKITGEKIPIDFVNTPFGRRKMKYRKKKI